MASSNVTEIDDILFPVAPHSHSSVSASSSSLASASGSSSSPASSSSSSSASAAEIAYKQIFSCDPKKIFNETKQQAESETWHNIRKQRITASTAHRILHARQPSTALSYFNPKPFTSASVEYGKQMESLALKKYQEVTSAQLMPSGVVVSATEPWMCATPDAFAKIKNVECAAGVDVVDDEIVGVEVKCPYTCATTKEIWVPYIFGGKLRKNHTYYTQVQIQMFCCNLKKTHFFVFSKNDHVLITVERDEKFLNEIIPKLKTIFFNVLIGSVVECDAVGRGQRTGSNNPPNSDAAEAADAENSRHHHHRGKK